MNTPTDYMDPYWETGATDWKRYISAEMRYIWGDFTGSQRAAIARNAQMLLDMAPEPDRDLLWVLEDRQ